MKGNWAPETKAPKAVSETPGAGEAAAWGENPQPHRMGHQQVALVEKRWGFQTSRTLHPPISSKHSRVCTHMCEFVAGNMCVLGSLP